MHGWDGVTGSGYGRGGTAWGRGLCGGGGTEVRRKEVKRSFCNSAETELPVLPCSSHLHTHTLRHTHSHTLRHTHTRRLICDRSSRLDSSYLQSQLLQHLQSGDYKHIMIGLQGAEGRLGGWGGGTPPAPPLLSSSTFSAPSHPLKRGMNPGKLKKTLSEKRPLKTP